MRKDPDPDADLARTSPRPVKRVPRGIVYRTTKRNKWWNDGRTRPEHMFIPDPQVDPGRPIEHLRWAAQYALDKRPDVIVFGQDWWNFRSLNRHEMDHADYRTRDAAGDLLAGAHGLDLFMGTLEEGERDGYKPALFFQEGNHDALWWRTFITDQRLWRCYKGPSAFVAKYQQVYWSNLEEVVCIDGVHYSHYFTNPMTGRALGGTALHKLNKLKFSFTMGHQQGKDIAEQYLANGAVLRGCVAGSFYQHNEDYKGPQGNLHWRGLIYKHEVREGNYDLMEVSIDFLRRRYGGKRVLADPYYRADEFGMGEAK
jgi:hypothetical protein